MYNDFKSNVISSDRFSVAGFDTSKDLLIIDRRVADMLDFAIKEWKHVYAVDAGEDLKEFASAARHFEAMIEMWGMHASRSSRMWFAEEDPRRLRRVLRLRS